MLETTLILLIAVIAVSLAFDVSCGMHDTGNSVGPLLATRAISPRAAVAIIAVSNGAGALLASGAVAATIGAGIVSPEGVTLELVLAAIGGAICWNVLTWYTGIPCSSSLALVGAIAGAGVATYGFGSVGWSTVADKAFVPSLLAPILGGGIAMAAYVVLTRTFRSAPRRPTERRLRRLQIGAAAMQAFAHGTNDAQKTMGVIALALLAASGGAAAGAEFNVPTWVKIACATSMSIGTAAGGWRIVRTMTGGLGKLDVTQGVSATFAGGVVLLLASRFGLPVSTTYVGVGGIMGAAACRGTRRVGWNTAGDLLVAWAITIPCAALVAGLMTVAVGASPIAVVVGLLSLLGWMLVMNHRDNAGAAPTGPQIITDAAWNVALATGRPSVTMSPTHVVPRPSFARRSMREPEPEPEPELTTQLATAARIVELDRPVLAARRQPLEPWTPPSFRRY